MAKLKVIREGWWRWIERGVSVDVTCTTSYVEDGGHKIIVDVPNAGEEQALLEALRAHDIDPASIDLVVVTHFHPDHTGCLGLFPNAEYISHRTRWHGAKYVRWEDEALPLTDDVYVLKTPGHSDHDCSVIVNTEDGVVACSGDLWVRGCDDPRLAVVDDRAQVEASRRRLAGLAKWIVPGHGPMKPSSSAKIELP